MAWQMFTKKRFGQNKTFRKKLMLRQKQIVKRIKSTKKCAPKKCIDSSNSIDSSDSSNLNYFLPQKCFSSQKYIMIFVSLKKIYLKKLCGQNSKTQTVTNLWTLIVTKLKNSNCDKTQILTKLKNSNCDKTQIVTKLINLNCDKTQKLKLWQN